MKTYHKYLIAALVLLASGIIPASQAATVAWGKATEITGDSDVSTNGALLVAQFIQSGDPFGDQTVNGVTFTQLSNASSGPRLTFDNTTVSTTQESIDTGSVGTLGGTFESLTEPYRKILNCITYGYNPNFTPVSLTFDGLTNGRQYEFQVWVNDPRDKAHDRTTSITAGDSVTLIQNVSGNTGDVGQFVIGTFTADGTSQTFDFAGVGGECPVAAFNAFQLRDITVVPK